MVWPKSTRIHWGSLNWLDQRVDVLPSTVLLPAYCAASSDDTSTGLFRARFVVGGGAEVFVLGRIVESMLTGPGGFVAYLDGLITIWSISMPSSRACTRTVCAPPVGNQTS